MSTVDDDNRLSDDLSVELRLDKLRRLRHATAERARLAAERAARARERLAELRIDRWREDDYES